MSKNGTSSDISYFYAAECNKIDQKKIVKCNVRVICILLKKSHRWTKCTSS